VLPRVLFPKLAEHYLKLSFLIGPINFPIIIIKYNLLETVHEGRKEGREGGKVQPSMLLLSPLELSLPLHLSPRLPVMGGSCSLPGCKREWLRQKGQYAGYLDTHFCILGPAHPLYSSLVSQRN
jgi:hypothetical protein